MQAQPNTELKTVDEAFREAERLIGWLNYVREDEYTATERKRLIAACERFRRAAQPIADKYLD